MDRKQKGFTLIELLIVVAIIGILAAIAIPNLLTAMQRSKQKRTMADMRSIATAWEARATDTNSYEAAGVSFPTGGDINTLALLADAISPTYIKAMPQKDGWGTDYEVGTDTPGNVYGILSYGRNKAEEGSLTGGATDNFDCDIFFSNGSFVQYPEGMQN